MTRALYRCNDTFNKRCSRSTVRLLAGQQHQKPLEQRHSIGRLLELCLRSCVYGIIKLVCTQRNDDDYYLLAAGLVASGRMSRRLSSNTS